MGARIIKILASKQQLFQPILEVIRVRGEKMNIDYLFLGIWDKENKMKEICELENILPENVAFIGDDVNDIGIINEVGFSACPVDAVGEIKIE